MRTDTRLSPAFAILLAFVFALSASAHAGSVAREKVSGIVLHYRPEHHNRTEIYRRFGLKIVRSVARYRLDFLTSGDHDLDISDAFGYGACRALQRALPGADCERKSRITKCPDHANTQPAAEQKNQTEAPLACSLVDLRGLAAPWEAKATPFWAQEYVGNDLIEEIVGAPPRAVPVGLIDGGFFPAHLNASDNAQLSPAPAGIALQKGALVKNVQNGHGTLVAGLMTAPPPVGGGKATALTLATSYDENLVFFDAAADLKKTKVKPEVVNLSITMGDVSDLAYENLKQFEESSVLVIAAGNSWPMPMERNEKFLAGILVGSMTPHGYPAFDSTESEEVTLMAPSDHGMGTQLFPGEWQPFGGTSGAAPQVSTAVARVLGYLPKLSVERVKQILKGTSLPTVNARQMPTRNGAGMLNSLRATAVAKRLASLPAGKREKIFANLDEEKDIFDFSETARKYFDEAQTLLRQPDDAQNCESRKKGFRLLRASYLLQPNEPARLRLIELYRRMGYRLNAEFFENFDPNQLARNLRADAKSPNFGIRQSVARTAGMLLSGAKERDRDTGLEILSNLLSNNSSRGLKIADDLQGFPLLTDFYFTPRANVGFVAALLSPARQQELANFAKDHASPKVREGAAGLLASVKIPSLGLLAKLTGDSDADVRAAAEARLGDVLENQNERTVLDYLSFIDGGEPKLAAALARNLGRVKSEPLRKAAKELALKSKVVEVRVAAVDGLQEGDKNRIGPLVKTEQSPEVLERLTWKAFQFGDRALVRQMLDHANPRVRGAALKLSSHLDLKPADKARYITNALFSGDATLQAAGMNEAVSQGVMLPDESDWINGLDVPKLQRKTIEVYLSRPLTEQAILRSQVSAFERWVSKLATDSNAVLALGLPAETSDKLAASLKK